MKETTIPRPSIRRGVLPLLLAGLLAGCYQEPSRFDKVQQETRGKQATAKEAVAGGDFNKFFPRSEGDYSVVYTQEKKGFAEAEVKKGGEVVVTLAVFDTSSNPDAAAKYRESTESLDGYPEVEVGSQGTAILVGDRIQIQVRSKDAAIDKAGRESWIRRFDLPNLAAYAKIQ